MKIQEILKRKELSRGERNLNTEQLHVLTLRETDVQSAVKRLCGDEETYNLCLKQFLTDPAMGQLSNSIKSGQWDDAFTAAHALKGVAGNMGFIPLMHSVGQLLILIRGGRTNEISESLEQVNSSYRDIIDGIKKYFDLSDEKERKYIYENGNTQG